MFYFWRRDSLSELKKFLASLATIKGDLSNITAPPFVLAPKSAVEFPASWAEHPSILVAPALEDDPQKRALLVLKWYLSSLRRQQYTGSSETGKEGVKKPLNAFLGELFFASFEDEAGTTTIVSEQVSHHPPVTACHLSNPTHGVTAEGYTAQKVTLSSTASVHIEQVGHALLRLATRDDETYLVTLPSVTVKGLLTGSLYPELQGSSFISSSTGFTARVDYEGKGIFGGTKNSFHAELYRAENPKDVLYTVSGQWNGQFVFKEVGEGGKEREIETYDTSGAQPTDMTILPVEEQDPWESRRAWSGVIDAIRRGDMGATAEEKKKVEQAQRDMRKREEEGAKQWQTLLFRNLEGDEVFERLARPIGESLQADRTKGVWRFDRELWDKAERPFRGQLTPFG